MAIKSINLAFPENKKDSNENLGEINASLISHYPVSLYCANHFSIFESIIGLICGYPNQHKLTDCISDFCMNCANKIS